MLTFYLEFVSSPLTSSLIFLNIVISLLYFILSVARYVLIGDLILVLFSVKNSYNQRNDEKKNCHNFIIYDFERRQMTNTKTPSDPPALLITTF